MQVLRVEASLREPDETEAQELDDWVRRGFTVRNQESGS
jgi:hypothetical protein